MVAGAICLLAAACGNDDTSASKAQANIWEAQAQFCRNLAGIYAAVDDMKALNPDNLLPDNSIITASFQAVRRQAVSVPNLVAVAQDDFNDAYSTYAEAWQTATQIPGAMDVSVLPEPLDILQTAVVNTLSDAQCPPLLLLLPGVQTAPAPAPTARPQ